MGHRGISDVWLFLLSLVSSFYLISCLGGTDVGTDTAGSVSESEGTLSLQVSFSVPSASALKTSSVAAGAGLEIHCEDYDGTAIGDACSTDDTGACTVTGLTAGEMEAGLVCMSLPFYALVTPSAGDIEAAGAGTPVAVRLGTVSSFAFAATAAQCTEGLAACDAAVLETLYDALVSIVSEDGADASTEMGRSVAAVYAGLENAFSNEDDTTDPTQLLNIALRGETSDFIDRAGDSEMDLEEAITNLNLVIEALLRGENPFASTVPCADEESCSALYSGTCNPPSYGDAPEEGDSYSYSDLAGMGVPIETIVCYSNYSEEGDTCLTFEAIVASIEDDDPCDAYSGNEVQHDNERGGGPSEDEAFVVDISSSATIFTLYADYGDRQEDGEDISGITYVLSAMDEERTCNGECWSLERSISSLPSCDGGSECLTGITGENIADFLDYYSLLDIYNADQCLTLYWEWNVNGIETDFNEDGQAASDLFPIRIQKTEGDCL